MTDEIDLSETIDREYKRYNIKLRVSVVNESGDGHYQGVTKDLSEGGLSILYPHNIYLTNDVTVLLSLNGPLIEIYGRMIYTVYSADDGTFRTGIVFKSFKDDGRKKLKNFLAGKVHYY